MSDAIIDILSDIGTRGLPTLAIVLVALWIGKLINDLLTRYKVDEELTGKKNASVGVAMAGYYIGLAIAIMGVIVSPRNEPMFNIRSDFQSDLDSSVISEDLRKAFGDNGVVLLQEATISVREPGSEWRISNGKTYTVKKVAVGLEVYETITFGSAMLIVAIYSIVAIVLLNVSALINDKLILYKFNNESELANDQNSGTGATMAGSYLATGLIVNAAVSGEAAGGWWKGLLACLIFFALGQLVLVIAGLWYQRITSYDIHKVIGEDNNVAAGIGFGGFLFAMGYVVRAAMLGESKFWSVDLVSFALYVVVALILLTITQAITDKVFLPKAKISDEIGNRGNVAAALIVAAIYAAVAFLIVSAV